MAINARMTVTAVDVSETFIASVLVNTQSINLVNALEKLEILECMTDERSEPEVYSLLSIVLETLKVEVSRHG